MLKLCPDTLIGKRDRALLCFGFAGAFRRSELCALEAAGLTETADGLRVLIRRSKGDQEGQGQEIAPQHHAGPACRRRDRAAGPLTQAGIDLAAGFLENEMSAATRRAYAFDWKHLEIWCLGRGACPLPAHQGLVAAYLSHRTRLMMGPHRDCPPRVARQPGHKADRPLRLHHVGLAGANSTSTRSAPAAARSLIGSMRGAGGASARFRQ
jgi:hypothetical protein